MYKKTLPRATILILVGCASFFLQHCTFQPGIKEPAQQLGQHPARLRIPAIKVDATVESVGLTSKGAMDVPKDPDNVAWYNLGPRPGEKGSAVLAGHFNWYDGKTAVFQHLKNLRKGDLVSVETDKGTILTFMVREIRIYHPGEYAPEVFLKRDGIHLNLVTCGGAWDASQEIYIERLVVFTDFETASPDRPALSSPKAVLKHVVRDSTIKF